MMVKSAAVVAVATIAALAASQGLVAMARPSEPAPALAYANTVPAPAEAQIRPPQAFAPAPAQVSKAADGHYWAEAEVDGRWIRFLVDTGASSVALRPADAQRLGIDLDSLTYDRPVKTANGDTTAAAVTLAHLSVAGARVNDVQALVVRDGLSTSLLGMTYLGRLSRFEATQTALILRP